MSQNGMRFCKGMANGTAADLFFQTDYPGLAGCLSSFKRTSIVSIRSSFRSRCTSYRASTSSLSASSDSPKA
jgi:hypothetical protein